MLKKPGTWLLPVIMVMAMPGCSLFPEKEDVFKDSRSNAPLEAPPGIKLPGRNGAYDIPEPGADLSAGPLADSDMRIERDGQLQWLSTKVAASELWGTLLAFWKEQNIKLEEADRSLGLIKTSWVESAAGLPRAGLKGMVSKALGTSEVGVRDQYSMRLEPDGKNSRIYLSHRGAVMKNSAGQGAGWELSQADPDQAGAMLTRLRLFLQHN